LRVWDLEGNQPPRVLEGHTGVVRAVALLRDGNRAISGSNDGTVRVWDLVSGRCLTVFNCDAEVCSCAWAKEKIVAGDGHGRVHLFTWEE
jgi:WD40 repeat protein